MCSCALHDNRPAPIGVCTCLCQEHDQFFDQGVVLVRQAVRRYQRVAQDEIKGVHNRLNAVNQLYDTVSADLSRLRSEVRGVASTEDRIIDRVDAIEERLSPPETASLSEMSIRTMEEKSRTKGLPPDKWDRYGVRWKCISRDTNDKYRRDFLWKNDQGVTQWGEDLEQRGPFTSKSPLAEDQEPLSDTDEAKDVEPDDEDGEWVNLHAFVPGTASPEKCDACGGPADGLLHEQPRGSGLWSEPWEPQFSDEDTDVLSIAIRQAVGAASACWDNLKGAGVFDDQKALWVASGLQRWIESRYQLFDQPAYQRIDNRLGPGHSESDRKSCMSCHMSVVVCDLSRTYDSKACCQFCEVETFKVAHPVRKTTKSEETSDGREHETDADSYMPLGTDSTLWAKEFLRVFHHGRVGTIPDEGTLIGWFANAIEAGRLAGTSDAYARNPARPDELDENGVDWKMRATAAETELALAREDTTHVANADRIRLAKDALVSSGYFNESDLTDDEIAPRIRELISAHNTGFFTMKGDLDRQITKWKDRALVAERRMSSVRQFVQDNLAAPINPEEE